MASILRLVSKYLSTLILQFLLKNTSTFIRPQVLSVSKKKKLFSFKDSVELALFIVHLGNSNLKQADSYFTSLHYFYSLFSEYQPSFDPKLINPFYSKLGLTFPQIFSSNDFNKPNFVLPLEFNPNFFNGVIDSLTLISKEKYPPGPESDLALIKTLLVSASLITCISKSKTPKTLNFQYKALCDIYSKTIQKISKSKNYIDTYLFGPLQPSSFNLLLNETIMFTFSLISISDPPQIYLPILSSLLFNNNGLFSFNHLLLNTEISTKIANDQRNSIFTAEYHYLAAKLSQIVWDTDFSHSLKTVEIIHIYSINFAKSYESSNLISSAASDHNSPCNSALYTIVLLFEQITLKFLGTEKVNDYNLNVKSQLELCSLMLHVLTNFNSLAQSLNYSNRFEPYKRILTNLYLFIKSSILSINNYTRPTTSSKITKLYQSHKNHTVYHKNNENRNDTSIIILDNSQYSLLDLFVDKWISDININTTSLQPIHFFSKVRLEGLVFCLDFMEHLVPLLSPKYIENKLVPFLIPLLQADVMSSKPNLFESSHVCFLAVLSSSINTFAYKFSGFYSQLILKMYAEGHFSIDLLEICFLAAVTSCSNANKPHLAYEISKRIVSPDLLVLDNSNKPPNEDVAVKHIKIFINCIACLPTSVVHRWMDDLEAILDDVSDQRVKRDYLLEYIQKVVLTRTDLEKREIVIKWLMIQTNKFGNKL
ncbi:hypothetical protein AYI70_g4064 [Smittium culicis]|uniref:Uncharacterized protein n=1 Tax=Smittium culicis TaxID=133412 RepID=A0A1R1Y126_9FUNG|nr:hypothetical protein AYI70_g4064 [Smittium culicis]